ncbi:MAG: hypothetical protein JJU11_03160 [Candidatus Sumerlaeia bacterium]|nr:hypothetical protein [Candidatus Sumerlaeia bacterium]
MAEGMLEVRLQSDELIAGEPFEGIVVISLGSDWVVKHAGVMLRWSAGNNQQQVDVDAVWQELVEEGTQMNPNAAIQFQMITPVMPWSFTGRQLRVTWSIGALVHPKGGMGLDVWHAVEVRPRGGNWSPPPLSSSAIPMV